MLVAGNKITKVAQSITAPAGATVIDAKGRTMSPGVIDAHVHVTLQFNIAQFISSDESQFALVGVKQAQEILLRGFTTARDTGENTFSLTRDLTTAG